jgi:hypothetical protein
MYWIDVELPDDRDSFKEAPLADSDNHCFLFRYDDPTFGYGLRHMVAVPPIVDLSLGCLGSQQWAIVLWDMRRAELANTFKVGRQGDSHLHVSRVTPLSPRSPERSKRAFSERMV